MIIAIIVGILALAGGGNPFYIFSRCDHQMLQEETVPTLRRLIPSPGIRQMIPMISLNHKHYHILNLLIINYY